MKAAIFGIIFLVSTALAQQCTNPKFTDIRTFTTQDTKLNTETSYVVQFRVQCANNVKNVAFFSEINGNFLSSSSDASGTTYQISWTEQNKNARTGEIKVRVFDEEGFSALKKAQRGNEDLSKVKELQTISLYHKGSYSGPYLQSELVATVLFGAIFYFAHSTRSNIQA